MQEHTHAAENDPNNAKVFAAVMTGKGSGAISTIQVLGDTARPVIEQIFTPAFNKFPEFRTGEILLGVIHEENKIIDQVTIGCEQSGIYAIHCHGNPLIVEMIIELLQRQGVEIISAEQLIVKAMSAQNIGTIEIEAKLAMAKARTIQGTKIISNQIHTGLNRCAKQWLDDINEIILAEIKAEAAGILQKSRIAKLIIYGCTVVLAGPPNSGKSTLFNLLTDRQGSIVTDIKGTTRDWVSQRCRIGSLSVELIDTAGLDEGLHDEPGSIEKAARQKSLDMLDKADLILLVLDSSKEIDNLLLPIRNLHVLTVLNKTDIAPKISNLKSEISNSVFVSAKTGTGIDDLKEKILQITAVMDFDLKETVCFTSRQQNLLEQLNQCNSTRQTALIIKELLTGVITDLTNTVPLI
jgi:tRNA modification GTPase